MGTTTTLAAAYAQEESAKTGPPCSVSQAFTQLDDDDAVTLTELLADPTRSHASIARALKTIGVHCSQGTIARHRHGDCKCQ